VIVDQTNKIEAISRFYHRLSASRLLWGRGMMYWGTRCKIREDVRLKYGLLLMVGEGC